MTVAEVLEVTAVVPTVKVAVLLPPATFTVFGTVVEPLSLASATETPPAGAAPLKITVPVADVPPFTLVGFTETDESVTPSFDVSDKVTVELAAIATLS